MCRVLEPNAKLVLRGRIEDDALCRCRIEHAGRPLHAERFFAVVEAGVGAKWADREALRTVAERDRRLHAVTPGLAFVASLGERRIGGRRCGPGQSRGVDRTPSSEMLGVVVEP
jgi:hypothetical protein